MRDPLTMAADTAETGVNEMAIDAIISTQAQADALNAAGTPGPRVVNGYGRTVNRPFRIGDGAPAIDPRILRFQSRKAGTAARPAPTHEAFIHEVRRIAVRIALSRGVSGGITADEAQRIMATKLVYGVGSHRGARGVCYFGVWQDGTGATVDLVEIAAMTQEDWIQLAGTTVHELSHVMSGPMAGHSRDWAANCERLGLGRDASGNVNGTDAKVSKRAAAAGQHYTLHLFRPELRAALLELVATMTDGRPAFAAALGIGLRVPTIPRPCGAGIGTRGGKSRGVGSGSRLLLWACGCENPAKVRASRTSGFDATCNRCGQTFDIVETPLD